MGRWVVTMVHRAHCAKDKTDTALPQGQQFDLFSSFSFFLSGFSFSLSFSFGSLVVGLGLRTCRGGSDHASSPLAWGGRGLGMLR